jgi:hypothetical protein
VWGVFGGSVSASVFLFRFAISVNRSVRRAAP